MEKKVVGKRGVEFEGFAGICWSVDLGEGGTGRGIDGWAPMILGHTLLVPRSVTRVVEDGWPQLPFRELEEPLEVECGPSV